MHSAKLLEAVGSVDWNANVALFSKLDNDVSQISAANYRLAVWSKELETLDVTVPAICFVREMQIAGQNTAAALSLALYKLAAGSMRTVLETALYYTYFRTHTSELATLSRDDKYFITKQDVLDYHKTHTSRFTELQMKVNLVGRLNTWYSKVSAVVHGQIPGAWIKHSALKDIACDEALLNEATKTFVEGEEVVHLLLLITVGRENWDSFSKHAKTVLLKGLTGEVKTLIGLDSA